MTIRLRLTLWYTALLGITLILFSVVVYSVLSTNLWMQAEQDSARQAREIANGLSQQLQFDILILRNNPARVQLPDLDFFASATGAQIVRTDGLIDIRSSNLSSLTIPNYKSAIPDILQGKDHEYVTTNGDTTLLVYSVPLVVNEYIYGAVQVIKQVDDIKNALSQVARSLMLGTAFCLVVAAIVGAYLARRTLAPIDTITRTAGSITDTGDLGRRLNITEQRSEVGLLAATFNAMLDQVQLLFDSQQRLIADVSHELRTPLTAVQGNVELLQRMAKSMTWSSTESRAEVTQEMAVQMLAEVEDETNRMSKMIGDLLLLAQADSGAAQLQMAPVELDTLVLDIYRQGQKIAERKKGPDALEIRLGDEDQALVYGDRERLRQLLINLMDNAIKYTPNGGIVTIGLRRTDDGVAVYVQDTGIGIGADKQAHIFERFYRTDKARSREMGGSGLGLSIVQWIADVHGGHVSVESELGEGSTFTFWLPLYKQHSDSGGEMTASQVAGKLLEENE
ncbi:MAG: HAMP domain-containing histidine kinase [Caldilineaceae bacterium]|nr:HAMP domain-containing histidine kinase [Caldilineaceae bacterium]